MRSLIQCLIEVEEVGVRNKGMDRWTKVSDSVRKQNLATEKRILHNRVSTRYDWPLKALVANNIG